MIAQDEPLAGGDVTAVVRRRSGAAVPGTSGSGSMGGAPATAATGVIVLPWPAACLSPNARVHHMARARATKAARLAAHWYARAAGVPCAPDGRVAVTVTFHPPSRRGDRHNMPAMIKAHIDGIADAMGVDDRMFDVVFRFGEVRKGGAVVVTVGAQA